jgi:hypothetical protein
VRRSDDAKTTELPDGRTVELGDPRANGRTEEFRPGGSDGGDGKTVELGTGRRRSGFWRELSGALAAGVVVLTVVVLALQVLSWVNNVPGLGFWVLIGHVSGAVLAVIAQRQLDRREGRQALLAGVGLGVVVLAVLVLFWWI